MRELEASLPLASHPKGEAQWKGDEHLMQRSCMVQTSASCFSSFVLFLDCSYNKHILTAESSVSFFSRSSCFRTLSLSIPQTMRSRISSSFNCPKSHFFASIFSVETYD
ncbi:hypothetical protein PGIGA_G00209390 [Pangasianodon gigas]|uniref:Uncharacterized protein n=1 Tax=Pangasianodon gigas TaxID=30993 RepID=A0ACC5WFT1_PANGG|nr:hypothetical protein [Pangasianodon gigas]